MGSTHRQRAFVALSILLSAMTVGAASDALAQAGPDMSTHLAGLDPTVASVLEGVRFGMSPSDLPARLAGADRSRVAVGTHEVRLLFRESSLAVALVFPDARTASRLRLDGFREARSGCGSPTRFRIDEAAGVRVGVVRFDGALQIELHRYRSIESILGDGPGLAFEQPRALLGSTADELEASYGESFFSTESGRRGVLLLGATDHSETNLIVHMHMRDGRVARWSLSIDTACGAASAAVLALLRASLGPLEGDAPYLRAASGVEVYAGAGDVRLSARATD